MKKSLSIVLAGSMGWLTALTASAQLTPQGVSVIIGAYINGATGDMATPPTQVVYGASQASASEVAFNNSTAGFASIGNVWVQSSAQSLKT